MLFLIAPSDFGNLCYYPYFHELLLPKKPRQCWNNHKNLRKWGCKLRLEELLRPFSSNSLVLRRRWRRRCCPFSGRSLRRTAAAASAAGSKSPLQRLLLLPPLLFPTQPHFGCCCMTRENEKFGSVGVVVVVRSRDFCLLASNEYTNIQNHPERQISFWERRRSMFRAS